MDHNKNDTLHLAWAVASEQMKTEFFWVLIVSHSCDLRPNQLSKRKFSSMLQCEQFFAHFSKNLSIQKLFWVVAIMVTGQLKTTKPYLWQLQLISQTLHEFLQRPCCLSQTLALKMSEHSCWGFSWNTWTISLRVHKYGFVLLNRLRIATTQFSATEKQQIIEKEEKAVPSNQTPKSYPAYSSKEVKNADYITTYGVASFDVMMIFGILVLSAFHRYIASMKSQQKFSAATIP